jgi:hypothetical protein
MRCDCINAKYGDLNAAGVSRFLALLMQNKDLVSLLHKKLVLNNRFSSKFIPSSINALQSGSVRVG